MADAANAEDDDHQVRALPEATGRDNQYHQYFVTITPTPGLQRSYVRVSVNQFDDKVIPQPKTYVPLSPQQVVATTLDVIVDERSSSCQSGTRESRTRR